MFQAFTAPTFGAPSSKSIFRISECLIATALFASVGYCQQAAAQPDLTTSYELGGQVTFIGQNELRFSSPYAGRQSFQSRGQAQLSHTYTLFLGKRFDKGLEIFFDPEMARGGGISDALGLAGYINGDVIRGPDAGEGPYVARLFARWTISQRGPIKTIGAGENQIPGVVAANRVVLTMGKFATSDIFDANSYANSTRTQFMNWDLINSAAYDYAADTRGYTAGVVAEWIRPSQTLRLGALQMPKVANGSALDGDLAHAYSTQLEWETHPTAFKKNGPMTVRVLGFRNVADMGNYRQALAESGGGVPVIESTRQPGRVKYGFNLNLEQPFGDDGETGAFLRACWNDGATESFVYTEADRSFSIGMQFSGRRWRTAGDFVGVSVAANGLSPSHRAYLEAGGAGFLLDDGRLNYGSEELLEAYYSHRLSDNASATLDFQGVQNPGYNRDRGPVGIISARVHFEF